MAESAHYKALRSEFAISRAKINKLDITEHVCNPRDGRRGSTKAELVVLPQRQRAGSRISERPYLKGIREWLSVGQLMIFPLASAHKLLC